MTAVEHARELAARAKEQRRDGDQDAALATLRSAQAELEAELAKGDEPAAAALADVLGQIGGALREDGRLVEAAAAYDAGYGYETRQALPTTYNALNRVVTRILICPEALADPQALRAHPELPWVDVPGEAARLHDVLAALQGRDLWAAGDYALTAALTGADPGDSLDRLARDADPFVRDSYRPIVERLARLDTPRRAGLERMAHALAPGPLD